MLNLIYQQISKTVQELEWLQKQGSLHLQHEGSIRLETKEGEGTVFVIELPF
jgi:predicted house-cleaning NTP pyrophosphatase (Maf/HAM1 superfamily)